MLILLSLIFWLWVALYLLCFWLIIQELSSLPSHYFTQDEIFFQGDMGTGLVWKLYSHKLSSISWLVGAFLVKPFYRRQVWSMVEKNLFISHVHAIYWWQHTGHIWDQDLTAWSLELKFSWECPAYQFKNKDCLFEAQETHKLICEWTEASSSVCLVRKLNGKTSGSELYEIPWISESISWLRLLWAFKVAISVR